MHQLLFGVGLVIVTLSPMAVLYGISISSPPLAIQAFFSFCLGVAFILIRNLVAESEEIKINLHRAMNDIYFLTKEIERLKRQLTP